MTESEQSKPLADEAPSEPAFYQIPEVREPTFFDYVVEKVIPEVFRFAEYTVVSGFILFLGFKTEFILLMAFGALLFACVQWYAMHKVVALVKALKFRKKWTMRVASFLLTITGAAVVFSALLIVLHIAAAQNLQPTNNDVSENQQTTE